jgi:hypothetical protein
MQPHFFEILGAPAQYASTGYWRADFKSFKQARVANNTGVLLRIEVQSTAAQ